MTTTTVTSWQSRICTRPVRATTSQMEQICCGVRMSSLWLILGEIGWIKQSVQEEQGSLAFLYTFLKHFSGRPSSEASHLTSTNHSRGCTGSNTKKNATFSRHCRRTFFTYLGIAHLSGNLLKFSQLYVLPSLFMYRTVVIRRSSSYSSSSCDVLIQSRSTQSTSYMEKWHRGGIATAQQRRSLAPSTQSVRIGARS